MAVTPEFRDRVLAWLADNVPAKRLQHIQGVEQYALALARQHGLDAAQAQAAGLMHDLAKYFPPDRLLQMAEAEGLTIDPICRRHPHLLHADASAIVARDRFGVRDGQVLEAIRNHTLGRPQMDALSCVVFVADALEPNRGQSAELKAMRATCQQDLIRGVRQSCDYSIRQLLQAGRPIHPQTVAARNWALECSRQPPREAVATP